MDYIVIENEKIGQVKAKLLNDKNPNTCQAIWDALPFEVNLSTRRSPNTLPELLAICPSKGRRYLRRRLSVPLGWQQKG